MADQPGLSQLFFSPQQRSSVLGRCHQLPVLAAAQNANSESVQVEH